MWLQRIGFAVWGFCEIEENDVRVQLRCRIAVYRPRAVMLERRCYPFAGCLCRKIPSNAGLPSCQAVAEALRTERHDFNLLDVAQLLKHMLALARRFGDRWSLSCLWFEVPVSIADRHRQELADFAAQIGADAAHFSALTYQELFARMAPFVGQDDSEYIAYLRDRYVGDKGGS